MVRRSRMEPFEVDGLVTEAPPTSKTRRRRWLVLGAVTVALILIVALLSVSFSGDAKNAQPSSGAGTQGGGEQSPSQDINDDQNNGGEAPPPVDDSPELPDDSPELPDDSPTEPSALEPSALEPSAPAFLAPAAPAAPVLASPVAPAGDDLGGVDLPLPETDESPTSEQDFSTWWDANVTLDSGIMYEVVLQIPHDATAFTQGLTFANGNLWESTGQYGHSSIRQLDPVTGDVLISIPLGDDYFGEGLTYLPDDKLVQITWKAATGYVWNSNNLTIPPVEFSYETTKNNEGWGITFDDERNELIVSDGSSNLIFWDHTTFEIKRTLPVVRQNGSPATNMNELEFWRGRVLANVWFETVLLVINPETGVVEKEYDFAQLWPKSEQPPGTNVFNGISVSDDPNVLYVTGKYWNRMYKIKLLPSID